MQSHTNFKRRENSMTDLKCSVSSCRNICGHLCSLNTVQIDGCSACTSGETSCGSFTPKSSSMTNSTASYDARPETKIKCQAGECIYNKDMFCSADSVQINGEGGTQQGTRCATFKAR